MKSISEQVILYLSKHFRKKISLEELARIAGISTFHFHRKFVEENDCTPHAYLENIRMQHARHLMVLFPDLSLTDVAFDCGYSSPGIFSRAFKKFYGVAPSKYIPTEIIVPENIHLEITKPLQIHYLSKKIIAVQKVPLTEKALNHTCQQLIATMSSITAVWGLFLDAPFHVPLDQCRYFMGTESANSDRNTTVLTMPSGYYTTIKVTGGFDQLKEKMIILNEHIKSNGYGINSLTGYEKIDITQKTTAFNYLQSTREIFVKIKRE